MSWHTPERKIEAAIVSYLTAVQGNEFDGVQIATRFSCAELTEPRIEIECMSADAALADRSPDPAVWDCNVVFRVISHYARSTDATAHDEICGQLADKLIIDETVSGQSLSQQIMAANTDEDVRVFQTMRGDRSCRIDEHSLVTEQNWKMRMVCQQT